MGSGHLLNGFGLLKQETCVGEDRLADGSDLDRAVGALEYGHFELIFQLFDLAAQRRLTDEAALRRTPEMACVGDGKDVVQVADIHGAQSSQCRTRRVRAWRERRTSRLDASTS